MSKISPISLSPAPRVAPKLAVSRPFGETSSPSVPAESTGSKPVKDAETRLKELEARLAILESVMIEHAVVLRDRIGQRLDRLEQKFSYEADGLRRALKSEVSDRQSNIIQLTKSFTAAVDRVESGQGGQSIQSTVQDLVSALAATRAHLDVLSQAVAEGRRGLAS